MLEIKAANAHVDRRPRKPRMIGNSSPVPADERRCALCEAAPPTRWWQYLHVMTWFLPFSLQRHELARQAPVFLCDPCTAPMLRDTRDGCSWADAPEGDY